MRTETIAVKRIPVGTERAEGRGASAPLREGAARAAGLLQPLQGLLLPLAILAGWELATRTGAVKPYFLPAPGRVAETFVDLLAGQHLLADIGASLATVLHGFLIGGTVGLSAGIAAGLSKALDRLTAPFLNAVRQVPPIAWLPLVVLWVGAGDLGKTVVIAKAVFFPVFLNTLQGIRGVGREHVEVARVLGFGRWRLLRHVVLPSALPSILVGVRYGVGLAWMMIVSAEMLSGRRGLGFLLLQSQDLLQTDVVFVVITVIGFVGYALDAGLKGAGRRLTGWKKEFAG